MLPEEDTIEFLREQVVIEHYKEFYLKSKSNSDYLYRVANIKGIDSFIVNPVVFENDKLIVLIQTRHNFHLGAELDKVLTEEQAKVFLKEKR